MLDGMTLDENSSTVAVTSWHDQLYLAWTGAAAQLNLTSSPDGREFMHKHVLAHQSYGHVRTEWGAMPETRPMAPSLAGPGDQLYMAWKPGGDRFIWILTDPENPDGALAELQEARSYLGPALCSHQGSLALAWTGTDRRINILTGPQGPHGTPVRLEQARSRVGPALCTHRGSLALAWTGGDHCVNILTGPENPDGTPVRLEEARSWGAAPALCSHQGSLALAWTGGDRRINILTGPENPHGRPVRLEQARSRVGPAICSHRGSLIVAWSGTDGRLNLARLQ